MERIATLQTKTKEQTCNRTSFSFHEDSNHWWRGGGFLPRREPKGDDAGDGGNHLRAGTARVAKGRHFWRWTLQLHELVCQRG